MSKKTTQIPTAAQADNEASARRHLLALGLPAAAALLTACGGSMFGGSNAKSSKADKAANDLGGGKPNPAAGEGGPKANVDPANPTTVAGPILPGPCDTHGPGIIALPPMGSPPALDVKFKAYGDQVDCMVVLKCANLVIGDTLMLVAKIDEGTGQVLARRKITGIDTVSQRGVVIFDGVHVGVAVEKLTAVVYRDKETQLRAGDVAFDGIFQRQIRHPVNAADTAMYHIVDAFSVRGAEGYQLKGAHPNYYDATGLTVCMAFGNPTGAVSFGKQGAKGQNDRPYVQASASASSWASPPASYLPKTTTTHHVCDAFGDPIPGLENGFVAGAATSVLRTHNVLIVYVRDNDHYHRYFFHVG